jgi:cell division septation protein DedD
MTSTPTISDQTDATQALYKSVIGPINQSYYLRVFAHFDAKGKTGILWHWPACLSTLNWLVFRKMWGMATWVAGLFLCLLLTVFGIGKLVFSYSEAAEWLLAGVSLVLAFVLPGMYANAAYYRFCERTINSVLVPGVSVTEACGILTRRSSSRKHFLGLATLNLVVLAMLATSPGGYLVGKKPSTAAELPPELISVATPVAVVTSASVAASAPAVPFPAEPSSVASAPVPVPSPTASTPASSTPRPVAQQYFIQVGAFAKLENARKTMTQLQSMGLDAGAAPVVVRDGRLTRIRVGPFKTRAEASKAADQIKAQGLPALFVKL